MEDGHWSETTLQSRPMVRRQISESKYPLANFSASPSLRPLGRRITEFFYWVSLEGPVYLVYLVFFVFTEFGAAREMVDATWFRSGDRVGLS